jgi:hypothetical protein
MGSIIGKESVAEPPFRSLLQTASQAKTPYEVREYGSRFAGTYVRELFLSWMGMSLITIYLILFFMLLT